MVTIQNVRTFVVCPGRCDLLVARVETNVPGLYGLGCGTFTQRIKAVQTAIDEYLTPMVKGKNVANIEDIWQTLYGSSYWRNGPVLNNAISAIDEALWDIKGKMAGMPVYDLLGGKCREGALVYASAMGKTLQEVGDSVQSYLEQGYRHVRCHYGSPMDPNAVPEHLKPENAPWGNYINPKKFIRDSRELFAYLRQRFGDEPEFMIDVHEKLTPAETITLAKELEPYKLFFLEDSLPPELPEWFAQLRSKVATPIAMGELFNNVNEFKTLISGQYIDYIRCHISQLGGLTPARKLAAFCEFYGVRTAWHGPGDLSPVGMAAQVHLDLAVPNFGLQEHRQYDDATRELFPGAPEIRNCYLYVNEAPGLGVDFDESLAAKYPPKGYNSTGFLSRLPDGTAVRS